VDLAASLSQIGKDARMVKMRWTRIGASSSMILKVDVNVNLGPGALFHVLGGSCVPIFRILGFYPGITFVSKVRFFLVVLHDYPSDLEGLAHSDYARQDSGISFQSFVVSVFCLFSLKSPELLDLPLRFMMASRFDTPSQ
jgi:hypothetical protein